jgi:hypothetical protein
MAQLNILNLTCVKKHDTNATRDEVSLHLDSTKVFGPEKIDNGDRVPVGVIENFTGSVGVELTERNPQGSIRIGGFSVSDAFATLPGNTDHFGVFDDEFPDTFYYVEYHVSP